MLIVSIVVIVITVLLLLNKSFFHVSSSIFLTVISSLFVLGLVYLSDTFVFLQPLLSYVESLDVSKLVLNVLLGFLLFIGAMNFSGKELMSEKWSIIFLSVFGTIFSTVLIGFSLYYLSLFVDLGLGLRESMLFGVIISPTDSVTVLGLMKKLGLNKRLLAQLEGESLFNDGVSVVLFLLILSFVFGSSNGDASFLGELILREVGGGLLLGTLLGILAHFLIKASHNDSIVTTLVMLSVILGGGQIALMTHVSGSLAIVIAGLIIGNTIMKMDLNHYVEEHLRYFWKLIEKFLNVFIFLLIGICVIYIIQTPIPWFMYVAVITIVFFARVIVMIFGGVLIKHHQLSHFQLVGLFSFGGLKGALSIALVLMLHLAHADIMIALTGCVVLFSIIVQGSSLPGLIRALEIKGNDQDKLMDDVRECDVANEHVKSIGDLEEGQVLLYSHDSEILPDVMKEGEG